MGSFILMINDYILKIFLVSCYRRKEAEKNEALID